jgi:hypothetical protein
MATEDTSGVTSVTEVSSTPAFPYPEPAVRHSTETVSPQVEKLDGSTAYHKRAYRKS